MNFCMAATRVALWHLPFSLSRAAHDGAYFRPEVARQLNLLGAEDGTTMRMLMAEALDLLFASRGRSTIAR